MYPGAYDLRLSGLIEDRFAVEKSRGDRDPRNGGDVKTYTFDLPPGRHAVRVRCTPPPDFIPFDHRKMCYFIKDFEKAEVP